MAEIDEALVEKAARSDAKFDGRDFDAMGRADRQRYCDRARAALAAVIPAIRVAALEEAIAELLAMVEKDWPEADEVIDVMRGMMSAWLIKNDDHRTADEFAAIRSLKETAP